MLLVGFDSLLEGAEFPVQFVDLPVLHAVVEQIAGGAHAQDRVGVLDGNPGEDVQALGNQGLDLHQGDFVSVLAQAVEGRAEPGFLQPAAEGGLADAGPAGGLDDGGGREYGGQRGLLAAGKTGDVDGPPVFAGLRGLGFAGMSGSGLFGSGLTGTGLNGTWIIGTGLPLERGFGWV